MTDIIYIHTALFIFIFCCLMVMYLTRERIWFPYHVKDCFMTCAIVSFAALGFIGAIYHFIIRLLL